ncbi:MAG: relaxase/mobilization nuclease domain-containing protein [Rhizobiaceae bacterium]
MILDGNQRGGARNLAIHLMKPENEHIELHEIRGFAADTLKGALREAEAVSRGTRCRQFLYSLSLSPPETERVPVSAFENAIERIETKLGLTGHARIVVFHEKEGRRHAHCVWSRINPDSMTAVRMSHDRRKLGDISRQLFMEHSWRMPEGLIDRELRNPLNFDRKEWFQARRVGKDPRDIKNTLQQCWAASDSGRAFRSALEQRGYWLARGDRGGIVAVDVDGGVYAVARWMGLKTKDVRARIDDLDTLPSVDEAQMHVARLVRDKLTGFVARATDEFAQAAKTLEGRRMAMVERHRTERRELQAKHDNRWLAETKARADRFRKGIRGLWDRVTGQYYKLRKQSERETLTCTQRDADERQALIERQLFERQRLQREINQERRAHVREMARFYREIAGSDRIMRPSRSTSDEDQDSQRTLGRRQRRLQI